MSGVIEPRTRGCNVHAQSRAATNYEKEGAREPLLLADTPAFAGRRHYSEGAHMCTRSEEDTEKGGRCERAGCDAWHVKGTDRKIHSPLQIRQSQHVSDKCRQVAYQ